MIDLKKIRSYAEENASRSKASGDVPFLSSNGVIELLDQLEAAKRDAARYQWLRASKHFDSDQHQIFCTAYGYALDVSIDAAMAATEGEA